MFKNHLQNVQHKGVFLIHEIPTRAAIRNEMTYIILLHLYKTPLSLPPPSSAINRLKQKYWVTLLHTWLDGFRYQYVNQMAMHQSSNCNMSHMLSINVYTCTWFNITTRRKSVVIQDKPNTMQFYLQRHCLSASQGWMAIMTICRLY